MTWFIASISKGKMQASSSDEEADDEGKRAEPEAAAFAVADLKEARPSLRAFFSSALFFTPAIRKTTEASKIFQAWATSFSHTLAGGWSIFASSPPRRSL